jgi:hypothetical protein
MRGRGLGRIVNVGSVGGLFTAPGAGAYHMSKYAVEALSDALRYEVKSFGVDVVLVQPTGVRTPFVETPTALIPENEGPYAAFNENYNAGVKAMFAEGRRGIVSAEDVAGAIVEAAGAARPRARYKVGLGAHVIPRVRRLLGDRAWDAAMARQFPMTPRETPARRTAEVGVSTRASRYVARWEGVGRRMLLPSCLRRIPPPPPRHPDGKGGDAWTWKASYPPCIRWWTIGGGSCTRRPRANPVAHRGFRTARS